MSQLVVRLRICPPLWSWIGEASQSRRESTEEAPRVLVLAPCNERRRESSPTTTTPLKTRGQREIAWLTRLFSYHLRIDPLMGLQAYQAGLGAECACFIYSTAIDHEWSS